MTRPKRFATPTGCWKCELSEPLSDTHILLIDCTDEKGLVPEFMRRVQTPHEPVEVSSSDAPVHQRVLTGAAAAPARVAQMNANAAKLSGA